jgi:transcriptional regulator with GAF, ATPase, and Fis domain
MQHKISDYAEFEKLHNVLGDAIRMHERRSLGDGLKYNRLESIVQRLAMRPLVALARLWVVRKAYWCHSCSLGNVCEPKGTCLHLIASHGNSLVNRRSTYARTRSFFNNLPLNHQVLGHMAASANSLLLANIEENPHWMIHPDWAKNEGILWLLALPIHDGDQMLGLLTLFTRMRLNQEDMFLLRMFANQSVAADGTGSFKLVDRQIEQLEAENQYLREELDDTRDFGSIIGKSAAHQRLIRQIDIVAQTDASVLIMGESGTGKELLAREIHNGSLRGDGPLIKINCASIPAQLFESEFFGHAKGAFTGAVANRKGRYEAADKGTLFLDELGEIPLTLQPKLLRLLQEGEFERVGENTTRRADVRIIAATNQDLKGLVAKNRFRHDLYYRINVFPIEVPPLRNRKEDIAILARHFLKSSAKRLNCTIPQLTRAHTAALEGYPWPGNVRELQNIIERAVIVSRSQPGFHLPDLLAHEMSPCTKPTVAAQGAPTIWTEAQMRRRDRNNIIAALEQCRWKVYGPGGAAELLEMKPTTLYSKIKAMGITKTVTPGSGGFS